MIHASTLLVSVPRPPHFLRLVHERFHAPGGIYHCRAAMGPDKSFSLLVRTCFELCQGEGAAEVYFPLLLLCHVVIVMRSLAGCSTDGQTTALTNYMTLSLQSAKSEDVEGLLANAFEVDKKEMIVKPRITVRAVGRLGAANFVGSLSV